MGGKTGTTTQSVQIPPEVLARYNAVNTTAEKTAAQPFQQYSTDPNAFVAPLNQQQQAGISNINQYANAAQPAYGAAMQGTANAYGGLTPEGFQQGVSGYMNPFVNQAMGATAAQMQNINQQEQQKLLGNAISQGAFGGDRGNIAQAALMNQQNLAMGQTLGQMASQGYQNAAQNYLAGIGQQGALSNQMGALGIGAQTAGLTGAQAQLGAGTLGQQTTQAGNTALYNQFLQQQAYPFQVAQFLANIAEGTGALSGSTTTTQQPMPFFSDRRLKEDIKRVGTAHNGLPIYTFKYKGDPAEQTHIGFMADEVEKKHPEAVGLAGGYKTVDYDRAARAEGGLVMPQHEGMGFGLGGREHHYDGDMVGQLTAAQKAMYEKLIEQAGQQAGRTTTGTPGMSSYVPQAQQQQRELKVAGAPPANPQSGLSQVMNVAQEAQEGANFFGTDKYGNKGLGKAAADNVSDFLKKQQQAADQMGRTPEGGFQASGGLVGYADGGDVPYEKEEDKKLDIPEDDNKKQHGLMTAANPTGAPSQTGLSVGDALGAAKMAASAGPAIGDFLASLAMFANRGGAVEREHHDGSEGNVVGGGDKPVDDPFDTSNGGFTKAVPDHWKPLLTAISGPESGNQYDIVNGGKTHIDPHQPHPGLVGEGGTSTASGRYQFTKDTWNDTTGNQPMTPFNQDAAAIKRATLDYKQRTGRDLDADLKSNGVTKDMISSLAPTWSGLGPKQKFGGLSLGDLFGVGSAHAQEAQQQGGLGDLMTTQNVVPLLAGLGAMASSNSPYLGSAILQGLGAGAKTYAGIQTQQAGLKQTEAETAAKKAETAKNRVFAVGNQLFINAQYPDGTEGNIMSAYDWLYGDPKTRPRLTADQENQIREYVAKNPSAGLKPPAAGSDVIAPTPSGKDTAIVSQPLAPLAGTDASKNVAEPAQVKGESTTAPQLAKGETSVTLSPDALNLAKNNLQQARVAQDPAGDVFSGQSALGRASRDQRSLLLPLAGSFSRIPETGGSSGGQLQAVLAPVMDTMNHFGAVLGAPNLIKNPNILTDQKEVDKLVTQLQAQATSAAGQHAYAALQTLSGALPSNLMDKNSQARLMAQLITTNQKEIDRDNYFNQFYNTVASTPGGAAFAKYAGKGLDQQFENDYNRGTYSTEAANLERMFKTPVKERNKRNLMDVLTSGEQLTNAQKASIRNKFGNKILRYFNIDE